MNRTPAFNPFPAINAPAPAYNPLTPLVFTVSVRMATIPVLAYGQLGDTASERVPRRTAPFLAANCACVFTYSVG